MAESDAEGREQALDLESVMAAYRNSQVLNASCGEISAQQKPAFDSSAFLSNVSDSPLPSAASAYRKPNFSNEDKFYLIEQFEKNRQILEAQFGNGMREAKRETWQAITEGLNEPNPLITRTAKEVRKKWENMVIHAKKAYADCKGREENGLRPQSLDPIIERIIAMLGGATPNGIDRLGDAIDVAALLDESACGKTDGNESKSVLNGHLDKETKAAHNYSRNVRRSIDKSAEVGFMPSGCNSNGSAKAANTTNARLPKRIKLEIPPRSVEDAIGAVEAYHSTSWPLYANVTHDAFAYYQHEQQSVMSKLSSNFLSSPLNGFPQFAHQSPRQDQLRNRRFRQHQEQLTAADDKLPNNGAADKNEASTRPSDDCHLLQLECLQLKKQNLILEQERISLEKQKLSAEIAKINSEKEKIDLEIAFLKKRAHHDS